MLSCAKSTYRKTSKQTKINTRLFLFYPSARLVEGRQSPREGLVQVYYNKTWSWVCADQWDKKDADVACRMMDFNGSLSAFYDSEKLCR